jgi:hypothetical protein
LADTRGFGLQAVGRALSDEGFRLIRLVRSPHYLLNSCGSFDELPPPALKPHWINVARRWNRFHSMNTRAPSPRRVHARVNRVRL